MAKGETLMCRLDTAALATAVDNRRRRTQQSWGDVAEATGIGPSTLARMINSGGEVSVSAHTLVTLLWWLNLPAKRFTLAPASDAGKTA